jgi:hypothetical protein
MNVFVVLVHTPFEGYTLCSIHLDQRSAIDAADEEDLCVSQWATVREVPVGMSWEQGGGFRKVYERNGPTFEDLYAELDAEDEEDRRDQIRDNKLRKKLTEVKYSNDWKRLGNYRAERQAHIRSFHRASRRQAKQELVAYLG